MNYFLLWLVLFVIVNGFFSWIVGYIASQKGRSFGAFFALSFFLSFLVGILAVIAIPRREIPAGISTSSRFVKTSDGEKAKCPYCAEWVKSEALVCRYCGKDISAELQVIRLAEAEGEIQFQYEEQAKRDQLVLKNAEKQAKREERNKLFLRSKSGKVVLVVIGLVVVGAIVGATSLAVTSLADQQKEEAKRVVLASDCVLVGEKVDSFESVTTKDLNTNLLPSNPGLREQIVNEINTAIPGLIEADKYQSTRERNYDLDGYYDGQYSAGQLGRRMIYNNLIEGTQFPPAEIDGIRLDDSEFLGDPLYECSSDVSEKLGNVFYEADTLGVAALVIRSCKEKGYYLEGIPCD